VHKGVAFGFSPWWVVDGGPHVMRCGVACFHMLCFNMVCLLVFHDETLKVMALHKASADAAKHIQ